MEFAEFKLAMAKHFANNMAHLKLFRTATDKDEIFEHYLKSFPAGSNPMFRERTEHDCSACKSFIRQFGNIVAINEGSIITLWDLELEGPYGVVAEAMGEYVATKPVQDVLVSETRKAGVNSTYEDTDDGVVTWEHFAVELPKKYVEGDGIKRNEKLSRERTGRDVFYRALSELTLDAVETVIELIDNNSLYRGAEHRATVSGFLTHKKAFESLDFLSRKELYAWEHTVGLPTGIKHIRNSAIGTLLIDLSSGVDLVAAVRKFEAVVAPHNYKRPTALITKGMIEKAEKTIEELGYTTSLPRRFAVIEDITVNNVLWADKTAQTNMAGYSVFDEMKNEAADKLPKLDKVEEVNVADFVENILPHAESLEIMIENGHLPNFMSLVAPVYKDAKSMFKWPNNFSWAYNGGIADSMKERVKSAGGNVDGDLRCSLSWFNHDDLDLHLAMPNGEYIYYSHKKCKRGTGANLDVDMNAGHGTTREPVENICIPYKKDMPHGKYRLKVHQFCKREDKDVGFDCEIEFNGRLYSFHYDKAVRNDEKITVAEFTWDGIELKMLSGLKEATASKDMWGIKTMQFVPVSTVMFSPNHWDGNAVGNKHVFFTVRGCINDEPIRGFFNEFLDNDLNDHRKVFEILGGKMKAEPNAMPQLSGVGFSSTQRNHLFAKVTGKFTRTVKILF